jgi:hypothetical protein
LTEKPTNENLTVNLDIIREAYSRFFAFVSQFVGEKKTDEFSQNSYRLTCRYFSSLESLRLNDENVITSEYQHLKDRDILGFSLWMYNFVSELKNFMIGVGDIDVSEILGPLQPTLEEAGFFEYFQQAEELNYFE